MLAGFSLFCSFFHWILSFSLLFLKFSTFTRSHFFHPLFLFPSPIFLVSASVTQMCFFIAWALCATKWKEKPKWKNKEQKNNNWITETLLENYCAIVLSGRRFFIRSMLIWNVCCCGFCYLSEWMPLSTNNIARVTLPPIPTFLPFFSAAFSFISILYELDFFSRPFRPFPLSSECKCGCTQNVICMQGK